MVSYQASDFQLGGSPGLIRGSASTWLGFSSSADTAATSIHAVASGGAAGFTGPEGDLFLDKLNSDLEPQLRVVYDAWNRVGSALNTFATTLENLQSRMSTVRGNAQDAAAALSTAQSNLGTAQTADKNAADSRKTLVDGLPEGETAPPDNYQPRSGGAQTSVTNASNELQGYIDQAGTIRGEHADAVRVCKSAINDAKDLRFEEPPGWLESAFDSAVDWIADHADILKAIADILNQVSMIAGMLSFIPGMAALALITGAAALLINVAVMAATGDWDVASLVMDAAGLIPGVKALKGAGEVADGAKVATNVAEEGAEAIAKNADEVAESAVRNVDAPSPSSASKTSTSPNSRCGVGEPIDVVTGEMYMDLIDLELPGTLPLVLTRTHLSSYRYGRWFGRSWASTLDQRIVATPDGGAAFLAEDGTILHYPGGWSAPVAAGILPTHGRRRWTLTRRADGGFELLDPLSRLTRVFAAPDHFGAAVIHQIVDPYGNVIDFVRDADGSPTALVHSGGYLVRLSTEDGRLTALELVDVTDERTVRVRGYSYDGLGQLVGVENSSGLELMYAYDEYERMVNWVDRNGLWYSYTYDDAGRCVHATGRGGALDVRLDYFPGRTTVTDSLGAVTLYRYNELSQVTHTVDPLGHTRLTEFDRHHRLVSDTDEIGRTTRYRWDDCSALIATTYPDGAVHTIERNRLSQPVLAREPSGATWTWEYDATGNPTAEIDPMGVRTTVRFERGALVEAIDALGAVTSFARDAAGRPTAIADPAGGLVRRWFDPATGRMTELVDEVGAVSTFAWTADGKPASRGYADGSVERWLFDAEENLLVHTDRLGGETRYEIGVWDLPVARTDPDGARHTFRYDTELRLIAIVNPAGAQWSYGYDAHGRVVSESDFAGRTLRYRHDPAGQLVELVTATGAVVRAEFDAAGRRTRLATADGDHRFDYDITGRVVRASSPGSLVTFDRDRMGRVLAETTNGRTVTYARDVLGRRTARTNPSGLTTTWDYDVLHQVAGMTSGGHPIAIARDGVGREIGRTYAAGATFTMDRDAMGSLRELVVTGADRTLVDRSYRYRADGALTAMTDRTASRTVDFVLDPMARVLAVGDHSVAGSGPSPYGWNQAYAYDLTGNIAEAVVEPGAHTGTAAEAAAGRRRFEYANSRVTRVGDTRYGWDVDGRMVTRSRRRLSGPAEVTRFRYDSLDRLTEVVLGDGTTWRYDYDTFGRRIGKFRVAVDGTAVDQVVFVWDGDRLVEQATLTPTGPEILSWEYGSEPFRPIAQHIVSPASSDARFCAVVTDLVGTPTELVTADGGQVLWSLRSETVWGALTPTPGSGELQCPLSFPGQYRDEETGLHYNRHRYYDPESGRYSSTDPMGLSAAPDPHRYVANPTRTIDPFGLHDHPPGSGSATGSGADPVPGPNGAMRDPETGRFAPNPDRPAPSPSSSTHGNSRQSTSTTYVYRRYDADGNYLKTGVSQNPATRYSQNELDGGYVDVMTGGNRDEMLNLERFMVERDPGPLNREPWAGNSLGDVP